MKKKLMMAIILGMCMFSFSACGDKDAEVSVAETDTIVESETETDDAAENAVEEESNEDLEEESTEEETEIQRMESKFGVDVLDHLADKLNSAPITGIYLNGEEHTIDEYNMVGLTESEVFVKICEIFDHDTTKKYILTDTAYVEGIEPDNFESSVAWCLEEEGGYPCAYFIYDDFQARIDIIYYEEELAALTVNIDTRDDSLTENFYIQAEDGARYGLTDNFSYMVDIVANGAGSEDTGSEGTESEVIENAAETAENQDSETAAQVTEEKTETTSEAAESEKTETVSETEQSDNNTASGDTAKAAVSIVGKWQSISEIGETDYIFYDDGKAQFAMPEADYYMDFTYEQSEDEIRLYNVDPRVTNALVFTYRLVDENTLELENYQGTYKYNKVN